MKNRVREKEVRRPVKNGRGEIVIYKAPGGRSVMEVCLDKETVWLDARQMATLFGRDRTVIVRHIRNIYSTNELAPDSTCAKNAQVAADGKVRQVDLYNLDMIISVGYRVNSKRGTQFRIWATNVLREHIVKGYTANTRRLTELKQSLQLVEHVLDRPDIDTDQAKALLRVVTDYARALDLLDDYDHKRIPKAEIAIGPAKGISYEEALEIIDRLREKFGAAGLFGREKDQSLHSSLNTIMQTFGGRDLYPGLEDKAANLLYFLVKNHSFVDGNKRIAAALFLWYMEKNGLLYRKDGRKRFADNALVAITLLAAESSPKEKEAIVHIIQNLIDKRN
ncbi:MAG: Fic/DOC family protein [Candidatus Aminicenantes bacterium]|nr:MAG: Fic/DOC family protein [Candidatus Aminicenantes bacterium]